MGLLDSSSSFLSSSLINMYSKCGEIAKAQQVLEGLLVQDLVSWNALISGYVQKGRGHEALICFERMQNEGLSPDAVTYTCILKASGLVGDLEKGAKIHNEIVRMGLLEKDVVLGNVLVDMYGKCGAPEKARQVFEGLPVRDVASWCALIARYAEQGQWNAAFSSYNQMQHEGILPNAIIFICILKFSCNIETIQKSRQIHLQIVNMNLLEKNVMLGTALLGMYAKCGMLTEAKQILKKLPVANEISWSALIAGCAQDGKGHDALNCFKRMQNESISPNLATFICILKSCASIQAIDKGKEIHVELLARGFLERDILLGTSLLDMYAKCGLFDTARRVLEAINVLDAAPWNALITGYSQRGQIDEALNCFQQMRTEGLFPDGTTFICILKACSSTRALDKGEQIHNEIQSMGLFRKDIMVSNALVDMYGKCGMLARARRIHEEIPDRDVISWNALISGYVEQGQCEDALNCFDMMQSERLFLADAVSFICLLKACGGRGSIKKGKEIHEEIVMRGLLEKHIVLGNALIGMYAKCGVLSEAHQVLDKLPIRNTVSWNSLIAGYAEHGQYNEALNCFEQIQSEGLFPDSVTFILMLKACTLTGDLVKGREFHESIASSDLLEKDTVLGNAVVGLYAKCGVLTRAEQIFDKLPIRTVVSWSTVITGYVERAQGYEALSYLQQMQSEGIYPDAITLVSIFQACGSIGAIERGIQIHATIVNMGLLEKDDSLSTALINMYVKCGSLATVQTMFGQLPVRNNVSWSALIACYIEQGQGHEALNYFEQMQREGESPDVVAFTSALKACASTGSIGMGQNIHGEVLIRGFGKDIVLGNALVDMYVKCGLLSKAQELLKEHSIGDIISCNVLMAGFAERGQGYNALSCFNWMQSNGLHPDEVTFICLLNACSHSGLLNEAQCIYEKMTPIYRMTPRLEHHTCMVVAFGCAGHFDMAISVIKEMPYCNSAIWLALLGSCRKWGNVKLSILVFDQLIQVDNSCAAAYVLMGTIFAVAGLQQEAENVRAIQLKYTTVPIKQGKTTKLKTHI